MKLSFESWKEKYFVGISDEIKQKLYEIHEIEDIEIDQQYVEFLKKEYEIYLHTDS